MAWALESRGATTPVGAPLLRFLQGRARSNSYSYDAENRVTQVNNGSTLSNVYDASGRRVRKNVGSSFTEYSYGLNGSVQSEYNGSTWPTEYVYAGSKLIADYTNGTTQFIFADHLGSTRLVTGVNQSVIDAIDFSAFGQLLAGGSGTTHLFTGKERDEALLTDFGARYYRPLMRRFMTPDWAAKPVTVPYANFGNPQSLNLYAYVENNPTTLGDPDGHQDHPSTPCSGGGPKCAEEKANAAQNKKDPPPAQPKKGFGVLPTATAAADIGVVKVGATAQGAAGAGAFVDSNGHPSVGAMATGSTEANAGQHVAGTPKQDKDSFAAGAFAGVGAGVTVTNAGNVAALKSTTNTLNIDLGLGPAASISISSGPSGVWSVTVDIGIGLGIGVTETNSATATAPSQ